ncbi:MULTISPECIES: TlpA family protein disulfide reductase [Flavobacterium]|uniref:TlpA family protein disulfide reductase n=1 Tax=Flavobacterium jumunjinense TaxID=998845 RepID=A0ABV5GNA0_9FLAO|nr:MULTISPECIES: TlpA disulfide reductase family protein [Flavobacterium]
MRFLLFLIILSNFSCSQEKKKDTTQSIPEKNTITLVFKERTYDKDSIRGADGSVRYSLAKMFYRENNEFVSNELNIDNLNKTDTVTIITENKIYLQHPFHVHFSTTYILKPGDTAVFSYPGDTPYITYLNKNADSLGANEYVKRNVQYPLIDDRLTFFKKNKRIRNKQETEKAQKEYEARNASILNHFNALKNKNSIEDEIYQINVFKEYRNIEKQDSIFNATINLAVEKYSNYLLYSFYNKYPVATVKKSNGAFVDFRINFDNVLKIDSIQPKNKDFLLYTFLEEIISNFSKPDAEKYFQLFASNVSDKTLIKTIEEKYYGISNKKVSKESTAVTLLNENKKEVLLQDIISKYKGKVVYVDFWASWCAPCRAAMPASRKLHEKYKNIEFVYISIDKNLEAWQKAAGKEQLNGATNFLATNYPEAQLYKDILLKTIPRYFIYDKNGKLVNDNAPGPESEEITKELEKYM